MPEKIRFTNKRALLKYEYKLVYIEYIYCINKRNSCPALGIGDSSLEDDDKERHVNALMKTRERPVGSA